MVSFVPVKFSQIPRLFTELIDLDTFLVVNVTVPAADLEDTVYEMARTISGRRTLKRPCRFRGPGGSVCRR
jgi:hypothetical protein